QERRLEERGPATRMPVGRADVPADADRETAVQARLALGGEPFDAEPPRVARDDTVGDRLLEVRVVFGGAARHEPAEVGEPAQHLRRSVAREAREAVRPVAAEEGAA